MKKINVSDLRGNEILAVPVVSGNDNILLQSDTLLRDEYIEKLRKMNVDIVYIKDEEEQIQQKKHESAGKILKRHLYKVDETADESKRIISGILDKHTSKINGDLKLIGEQAGRIIDSIIEDPAVITNVTEIRNISTDMYSHCINVCTMSTILALRLKMTDRQVRDIAQGAILHDIGLKYIHVPYENIIIEEMEKNRRQEYEKHTIYGYSAIEDADWLTDTAKEIILLHHENIKGTGFPFQHTASKLKPEVRLVSVCDEFDSLISGIGNQKMKIYEAIEYIKVHMGIIFDATISRKLLDTVAVYPVGIKVITSRDEIGEVVRQNTEMLERPVIKMLKYADGTDYDSYVEKNLLKCRTEFIIDTL